MSIKVRVNINDMLEKLESMAEDDYTTVELDIDDTPIIEDSSISFSAIDSISGTSIEYGTIPYDDGEL